MDKKMVTIYRLESNGNAETTYHYMVENEKQAMEHLKYELSLQSKKAEGLEIRRTKKGYAMDYNGVVYWVRVEDDRDRLLDEYLQLWKENNNKITEMKDEIEKLKHYLKQEFDNIEFNDFNGKFNAIKRLEIKIKEKESYGKAIKLCIDIIFDKIESVEYKEK
jgi:hypothetical protein